MIIYPTVNSVKCDISLYISVNIINDLNWYIMITAGFSHFWPEVTSIVTKYWFCNVLFLDVILVALCLPDIL